MPTTPGPIQTRKAVAGDVPLILDFIKALADFEHLSHQIEVTEQSLLQHLFGERPCAEVLLAFVDDRPAGFALYFQNFSTFMGRPGVYLEDLFVRPELRGRGVGQSLVREVAARAVACGSGRMEWAVLDWNERAIEFYKGLGAVPLDDWTTFRVTGDALLKLARA